MTIPSVVVAVIKGGQAHPEPPDGDERHRLGVAVTRQFPPPSRGEEASRGRKESRLFDRSLVRGS
jgi:hypothetical protein